MDAAEPGSSQPKPPPPPASASAPPAPAHQPPQATPVHPHAPPSHHQQPPRMMRPADGRAHSAAGPPRDAKSHYNRAAAGAPLKQYHNAVKRYLINSVTARMGRCGALLDLCCGRGGDIDKWLDAGIREVRGVDISEEEVALARKRFEMKRGRHARLDPRYTFDALDTLGTERIAWGRQYDAVTCMFAAHFFPQSEHTLDTFLANAAAGLRDGGYFYGAIASGLSVLALLNRAVAYESPLLRVRRTWAGGHEAYHTFGSGYTFALGDTITNADVSSGQVVDDGAEEYLVFFSAFAGLAAKHGLVPDPAFPWDPEIGARGGGGGGGGLEPGPAGGKHEAFRMFRPRYSDAVPHAAELTKASRLYAAFVFQKRTVGAAASGGSGGGAGGAVARPVKRQREDA